MTPVSPDAPVLVGDIGGTNARFALAWPDRPLQDLRVLPTSAHRDLADAASAYLQQAGLAPGQIGQACMAIANPIDGDWLRMTNNHWAFSVQATQQALGLARLHMLNDWEAMAMAVPALAPHECLPIGPASTAVAGAPCGLLGPGTGLGVSSLVRSASGEWVPVAGEGGHVSMAPGSPREAAVLQWLWQQHPHVSAERVISGMGLENLHAALRALDALPAQDLGAAEIAERALNGRDAHCAQALDMLCALLGSVAGNLALTLGARGGIYLGGGMLRRWPEWLQRSPFRARFEAKGRFADYLRRIPTWLITAEQPALRGAAMALKVRTLAR